MALAVPQGSLHSDIATAGDYRNGTDFYPVRVDAARAAVFGNRSHHKEH